MKSKKKILIPLSLAIICLVAGIAGGIFITLKKNAGPNTSPEYYFSKSEEVPSITGIVGERSIFTSATETVRDAVSFLEAAVNPKAEPTETADDPKAQPLETSSEDSAIVYNYVSDTVKQDVDEYVAYLESEKNFIELTNLRKDEKAKDPSSNTRCLAGASQDKESFLSITITEDVDSYSISAVKENQPWDLFVAELWKSSYHLLAAEDAVPTTVSAEEQVRSATQKELNLPYPPENYKFISKRGQIRVDGNDYYCVSAYLPNETGTFDYECAFLLDAASGAIEYQYDEATGKTIPL